MNVQPIQTYYRYICQQSKQQELTVACNPLYADSFVKTSCVNFKGIDKAKGLLSQYARFSIEEYKALSEDAKALLRNEVPEIKKYMKSHAGFSHRVYKEFFFKEELNYTLSVAKLFKNNLNKIYGENNYTFISIGKSAAMLKTGIESLGVKSKIIPASGIRDMSQESKIVDALNTADINNYGNYLSKMGLDKNSIVESGSNYIFYDYTRNGTTLKKFSEFLKDKAFGLDLSNVQFRSINDDLIQFSANTPYDEFREIGLTSMRVDDFISGLNASRYKKIDLCPSVNYKDLGKTYLYDKQKQTFDAKLLMFHFCDKLY